MKGLACVCVCFLVAVAAGHSVPGNEPTGLLQSKGRSQMKTQETATSTDTANLGEDDNESSGNLVEISADDGSVVQRMQTADNQSQTIDLKCPSMPDNFFDKKNSNKVCEKILKDCLAKCSTATKDYPNFYANFATKCGSKFCSSCNNLYSNEGRCEDNMMTKVKKKASTKKFKQASAEEADSMIAKLACEAMRKVDIRKGSLLQDARANLIHRASEQDGLIKTAFTDETMEETLEEKCATCDS